MGPPYAVKPAPAAAGNRLQTFEQLGRRLDQHHSDRNPRRQRLAAHLHAAGPRPVLEALIEVAGGRSLDVVLERFGRIPVGVYHDLGAAELGIHRPQLIQGGRL